MKLLVISDIDDSVSARLQSAVPQRLNKSRYSEDEWSAMNEAMTRLNHQKESVRHLQDALDADDPCEKDSNTYQEL